jgi:hypothetical protein
VHYVLLNTGKGIPSSIDGCCQDSGKVSISERKREAFCIFKKAKTPKGLLAEGM